MERFKVNIEGQVWVVIPDQKVRVNTKQEKVKICKEEINCLVNLSKKQG